MAALWKLLVPASLLVPRGLVAEDAPSDGTCPAGGCDAADADEDLISAVQGEEEVSAMQKGSVHSVLRREEVANYKPSNAEECKKVPNINPSLPIVYDTSCPGLCCFETYPCRYCNPECYGSGACQRPPPTPAPPQPTPAQPTTLMVGEEEPSTLAAGEEGTVEPTTAATGEEEPSTRAVGEEGGTPSTLATGEEGATPSTLATGEEGNVQPTTAAVGEEGPEPSTRAAGEESYAALQVENVGRADLDGANDTIPVEQRKVGPGAKRGQCLVVVAGGLQDFNLKALVPRLEGEEGSCRVLRLLMDSYTPRNPQVDWNMQDDRLVVNGEVVKPTAMFIRYDVFGTHVDPVKRQAFFELWDGYARSHPGQVRFLNIGYGGRTNKLVTLTMAKSLGLEIPKTLATNSPRNALAFLGDAGKITKPLAGGKETERLKEAVTPEHEEIAAAFIQEELVQPEMRVFGVDGVFLCLGLRSPSIDYRLHQDAKLSLMPTCPKHLIPALHTIMKNMGLRYGAADFKTRASDGKWIFLEMNSEPMFSAFDRASNGLLRDMIASWLEDKYAPYKGCQEPSSPVVCANNAAA